MRVCFLSWLIFAAVCVAGEPVEALDLVNAKRAERGLPAYQRDAGLTEAAAKCAAYRADHLMAGHTGNDFAFLPAGSTADAAGCAAWASDFGACAMFETQYRTAGAAFVVGKNGLRFCQLFVRKGPPIVQTINAQKAIQAQSVQTINTPKAAAPKAGTVHCIQYTDMTKTKIAREWDEPTPAWLSAGGSMPVTIQGNCPNGTCPNARR